MQPAPSTQTYRATTMSLAIAAFLGFMLVAPVAFAQTPSDLTQLGTIIARVSSPQGGGNKNPEVIRDGDKPPVDDSSSFRQYDTWDGNNSAPDDWIGYQYSGDYTFTQVVFQEGKHFINGGWFSSFTVQSLEAGTWTDVTGLVVTPLYPGINDGQAYNTYTLDFDAVAGDGIRIHGDPGGSADFISIGEFEIFGFTNVCGDGILTAAEACDDGNVVDGDGCDSDCSITACGNGITTAGEACDDGNLVDGDGCDSDCSATACGNGIVTAGEDCDDAGESATCDTDCTAAACGDGATNATAAEDCDDAGESATCNADCTAASCGDATVNTSAGETCEPPDTATCNATCTARTPLCDDGFLTPPEQCEDGNLIDGDGCDSNCTTTACGNGITTAGEACDDGNLLDNDGCDSSCQLTPCGNGVVDAGEGCDDGNLIDGDGCDANCTDTACGNGITTAGEACDDGNLVDGDGCDSDCSATACGNGITTAGEDCDDGNLIDADGCDSDCSATACGNGITTAGEACDDGNLVDGDGCDSNCSVTTCGNGITTAGEGCDDGNLVDGDGCDSNCSVTACGNGIATAGEGCDDGNLIGGDGCTATCTIEGCGDGIINGTEECEPPSTVTCQADCTLRPPSDLTQLGTIIARVSSPQGGGNKDPEVIRDGDKPPIDDSSSFRQYDTWDGNNSAPDDWIGYQYGGDYTFTQVVFQEGRHFINGGWFSNFTVQALQGGTWTDVTGLVITPLYPGINDGESYNTYTLDFDAVSGDGIRIHGDPGGSADFISIGELEIFGFTNVCGDGVLGPPETCDDGNVVDGDGCDSDCSVTACGNGIITAGETCDDGNLVDGDGCDSDCSVTACGNGIVTAGEACDDAGESATCNTDCTAASCGDGVTNATAGEACDDAGESAACNTDCTAASCGDATVNTSAGETCEPPDTATCNATCTARTPLCDDGFLTPPEECEDGNLIDGDGCDSNCTATACGNGIVTAGEDCDDGNLLDNDACDSSCQLTPCGNGVVDPGEGCDDGNLIDGDGCDANCTDTACGNGITTAGEDCDDGNAVDGDGCDSDCSATACGNGITTAGEDCDDGNLIDGDGCDSDCSATACGNGITTAGEDCDDGNAVDGDGCDSDCSITTCGNGITTAGEGCDDGNLVDGDGCDSNCSVTACGNGITTAGEGCDDGNLIGGDGCTATCTIEGCGDGIINGTEECDPPSTVTCQTDCMLRPLADLTQVGTPIARVANSQGGGNKDLDVIRDGDKPPVGDSSSFRQYDTWDGNNAASDDWIGYQFSGVQTFAQVIFQEGKHFINGGWFSNFTVQALQGGTWTDVTGLVITPLYPGINDGETYNTYTLDFDAIVGDGIRIHGDPGGSADFISVGELEIFGLSHACGDGIVTPDEDCDDGDLIDGDGCDSNCSATACGNGIITAGETCDDGNLVDGDGCDSDCSVTACGNGIVTAGEACDDAGESATCDADCTAASCGDGVTNATAGEDCDDASESATCDIDCTAASCGDAALNSTAGEICDDGNLVDGDGCDSNCTATACGNGILTAGETCDDGNLIDGDGCDSNCTATACGNGIITGGETCDDGNLIDGDGCDSNCAITGCGNGIINGGEGCDDGNLIDGDGCDSNCTVTACGNGILTAGETCDDGNLIDGDGCDSNCTVTACGNGILDGAEECDDSNLIDGDGCDSNCTTTTCGNSIVTSGEACDDGNQIEGDGCDSNCTATSCGNGITTAPEQCDDGVANSDTAPDACRTDCSLASCGDDVVDAGEECDSGGLNSDTQADACRTACLFPFCGDAVADQGESCDDGNADETDSCLSTCDLPTCGDGFVQAGVEDCDDANSSNLDACLNDCTSASCGDGYLLAGLEECDDGVSNSDTSANACRTTCVLPYCGDGAKDSGENCEPAGTANCTAACNIPVGLGLPTGFQDTTVWSGLNNPTTLRFSSDGRIFVAEKSGIIKVFDSLTDTSADIFADLRTNVHNYWDRGFLGLALHPDFPTEPYVFVLYTLDAEPGGVAPRWGNPGSTNDSCPNPPGPTNNGCVVQGRLSRLTAFGNSMIGPEEVMIEDWCQQYPSHSIGALAFGEDGALYVSGGDGASFGFVDYGQKGWPWLNPCNDPPNGIGGTQTPPNAEGGALRSQDPQTTSDPTQYNGTILRVNAEDDIIGLGEALPDNPWFGGPFSDDDRIIAYGLRNPFRFGIKPGGSDEVWVGDVGWQLWEEIERVQNPVDPVVENFGWPCYEGIGKHAGYDAADLNICEDLYGSPGSVTAPHYTYHHNADIDPNGDICDTGSSSVSGVAFYEGGEYPAEYDGAMFFADFARDCIWAMLPDGGGTPDVTTRRTFVARAPTPIDLQIGPGGDLFYVDIGGDKIRRIKYFAGNQPPVAVAFSDKTNGGAPLTVNFDASGSSDNDPGDVLTYRWDLDGDGQLDDSTSIAPSHVYNAPGTYIVTLEADDGNGGTDTDQIVISAGNTPPVAEITIASGNPWAVDDLVSFSGSAIDAQDGAVPNSSLTWDIILHHCPSDCHLHFLDTLVGVAGGNFDAPDHEYPSILEIRLTATDAGGLTDVVSKFLSPKTVTLNLDTVPSGLDIAVNAETFTTPFNFTVVDGSSNTISAPTQQSSGGTTYDFQSWSDGGLATHNVVATQGASNFVATYTPSP